MNNSAIGSRYKKPGGGGPKSNKHKLSKLMNLNLGATKAHKERNHQDLQQRQMTDSQKKLLSAKRENMRNFLPAIYNSVNVTSDGKDMKSPSTSILQRYM